MIGTGLRKIFKDEGFMNLLRAENFGKMPKYVVDQDEASGAVSKVHLAFLLDTVTLPIVNLVPTKPVTDERRATDIYKKMSASVTAEGLSEAPVVARDGRSSRYFILDGYVRIDVLKQVGKTEVECLIARTTKATRTTPASTTSRRFRPNPRMILKAIANGVPEDRIAKALHLAASTVERNHSMLQGICPEAVDLLMIAIAAASAFEMLKRVKPMRQIEMAELMIASKIYSGTYARALYVATPENELVEFAKKRRRDALSADDVAKIEHEQRSLERDYVLLTESFGENMMELTSRVST